MLVLLVAALDDLRLIVSTADWVSIVRLCVLMLVVSLLGCVLLLLIVVPLDVLLMRDLGDSLGWLELLLLLVEDVTNLIVWLVVGEGRLGAVLVLDVVLLMRVLCMAVLLLLLVVGLFIFFL